MSLPFKDYLIGGAAIGIVVFGSMEYRHIEAVGALAAQLHAVDSTRVVAVQDAATALTLADQAAAKASAAQTIALRQIAAGRALQARTDSAARAASEERDRARHLLADSLATVSQLRAIVAALDSASRVDSVASARQHAADYGSLVHLLATTAADSVQHAADQRALDALRAVTAALTAELGVAKKVQPGFLARNLGVVAGVGLTDAQGVVHAGLTLAGGWKLF